MITICIFHTIYHHLKSRYASHHHCSGRISVYNFRHFPWCLLDFLLLFLCHAFELFHISRQIITKSIGFINIKRHTSQWILPSITCNNILDLRRKWWWHFSWDSQNPQEVSKTRWKQGNLKFLQAKRMYTLPQIPHYNWHPNWWQSWFSTFWQHQLLERHQFSPQNSIKYHKLKKPQ